MPSYQISGVQEQVLEDENALLIGRVQGNGTVRAVM
jgi:hypothetical protein